MKDFRKLLKNQVNDKKFDDRIKENIIKNCPIQNQNLILKNNLEEKNDNAKSNKNFKFKWGYAVFAVCMSLIIVFSIILLNNIGKNNASLGNSPVLLTININPSVEFTLDDEGTVVAQRGLNKDGEILLLGYSFVNLNSAEATKQVITAADRLGLLQDNPINIMIIDENGDIVKNIENNFLQLINENVLSSLGITNKFYVNAFDSNISKQAQKYGISDSMMQIINSACDKTGISVSEALNMPLTELVELANDYNEKEMHAFIEELDKHFEDMEESMEDELEVFEEELEKLEELLEQMEEDKNYSVAYYKDAILAITQNNSLFDGLFKDESELEWHLQLENLFSFFKKAEEFIEQKEDILDEIEDRFEDELEKYKEELIDSLKQNQRNRNN